MAKSPVVILYDSNGVAMAVSDGVAIPIGTQGIIVAGTDGANSRFMRTATDGTVRTDPTGTTTQPVSAASLPLPTGAATEATLALIKAKTDNLNTPLTTVATEATLTTRLAEATFTARVNTLGQKVMSGSTPVVVASDQSTLPISAASLPLPTGAATSALQTTGNTTLSTINTKLPAALVGGRFDENVGSWLGSTAPTVGQKTMAASIPVTFASNQSTLNVSITAPASSISGIAVGSKQLGGATAGSLQAVRATTYNEQASDAQRSISSSSGSDTSGGVGARTIRIDYMTFAGVRLSEIVILNGVTPVNTVATDICYIERLVVETVGSTGANVGSITLFVGIAGGGGTIGVIGVGNLVSGMGDGRSLWSHHYVPAGQTAKLATYIISAESGGSGTNAMFFLRASMLPQGVNAEVVVSDIILTTGPLVRQLAIPIVVVGPSRVVAYGVPGTNNVKLNASFDFSELPT